MDRSTSVGGAAHQLWLGLAAWRWMFISAALPALVYGLLPMRLPESPRYLVDLIGAGAALGALPDRARRITRRVNRHERDGVAQGRGDRMDGADPPCWLPFLRSICPSTVTPRSS